MTFVTAEAVIGAELLANYAAAAAAATTAETAALGAQLTFGEGALGAFGASSPGGLFGLNAAAAGTGAAGTAAGTAAEVVAGNAAGTAAGNAAGTAAVTAPAPTVAPPSGTPLPEPLANPANAQSLPAAQNPYQAGSDPTYYNDNLAEGSWTKILSPQDQSSAWDKLGKLGNKAIDYAQKNPFTTAMGAYSAYNILNPPKYNPPAKSSPGTMRPYKYDPITQIYTPQTPYAAPTYAAQGGLMGLATGGSIPDLSVTTYPQSGITMSKYAPQPNVGGQLIDGTGPKIDPFTGAQKLDEGGRIDVPAFYLGAQPAKSGSNPEFDPTEQVVGKDGRNIRDKNYVGPQADGMYKTPKDIMSQLDKLSLRGLLAQTGNKNTAIAGAARLVLNAKKAAQQGEYEQSPTDFTSTAAGGGLMRPKNAYAYGGGVGKGGMSAPTPNFESGPGAGTPYNPRQPQQMGGKGGMSAPTPDFEFGMPGAGTPYNPRQPQQMGGKGGMSNPPQYQPQQPRQPQFQTRMGGSYNQPAPSPNSYPHRGKGVDLGIGADLRVGQTIPRLPFVVAPTTSYQQPTPSYYYNQPVRPQQPMPQRQMSPQQMYFASGPGQRHPDVPLLPGIDFRRPQYQLPTASVANSDYLKRLGQTITQPIKASNVPVATTTPSPEKIAAQTEAAKVAAAADAEELAILRAKAKYEKDQGEAAGGRIRALAIGGLAGLNYGTYAAGGQLLRGGGDGVSDSIPAVIQGAVPQKAALADGEFVLPARIVSEIGNGSTEAGARRLYAMMDRIQRRRRSAKNIAADTKIERMLPA